MSLATGAAGVQLGPHALAIAADLNKAKGLSMRKTYAVLADCFGLGLSAGGLTQALARIARRLQPRYEGLALQLRQAQVVHSDETSWWGRHGVVAVGFHQQRNHPLSRRPEPGARRLA